MGTIALLTDYGLADGFVGMIKGTIKRFAPDCEIIDVSHNIASFDIRAAAFLLQKSFRFYPPKTVFLVVVDPGVGTERRILAVQAGEFAFVAPDNGILSYALALLPHKAAYSVENESLFLDNVGATFHGRDIMAPIAARLTAGMEIAEVGPPAGSYAVLPMPSLLKTPRGVIGEVVYIDKFGNLISNITRSDLPDIELSRLRCSAGDYRGLPLTASYAEGQDLSAIVSGFGTVEVFVNQGSAASRFPQPVGMTIAVEVVT